LDSLAHLSNTCTSGCVAGLTSWTVGIANTKIWKGNADAIFVAFRSLATVETGLALLGHAGPCVCIAGFSVSTLCIRLASSRKDDTDAVCITLSVPEAVRC
jgi:hypothetical protein